MNSSFLVFTKSSFKYRLHHLTAITATLVTGARGLRLQPRSGRPKGGPRDGQQTQQIRQELHRNGGQKPHLQHPRPGGGGKR